MDRPASLKNPIFEGVRRGRQVTVGGKHRKKVFCFQDHRNSRDNSEMAFGKGCPGMQLWFRDPKLMTAVPRISAALPSGWQRRGRGP
jgi:hypothetical protein